MAFCTNFSNRISSDANFCTQCGCPVGKLKKSQPNPTMDEPLQHFQEKQKQGIPKAWCAIGIVGILAIALALCIILWQARVELGIIGTVGIFILALLVAGLVLRGITQEEKMQKLGLICVVCAVSFGLLLLPFTFSRLEPDYVPEITAIQWQELELGEHLPSFPQSEGEVILDFDDSLTLEFYNVESAQYQDYLNACKEFGYTVDAQDMDGSYTAYNQDGFYLSLNYNDFLDEKSIWISLEDPVKQDTIYWPQTELVSQVPVPDTLVGEVYSERDTSYAVDIVGVNRDYFQAYTALCMEQGFDVDYYKTDRYFNAENADGISLSVEYKGFNTMSIQVFDLN